MSNSSLLSWERATVLVTNQTIQTPPTKAPNVVYNNVDTIIQLEKAHMNQILVINNTSSVRVNLPEFLTLEDIGIWIIIQKANIGDLSIFAMDDTYIENSALNGYIINNSSNQTWANISIYLAKLDLWKFLNAPLGTWTTI